MWVDQASELPQKRKHAGEPKRAAKPKRADKPRRARKRHVQLTLDQARKPDGKHGGWRPGAGRPRKPGAVSHDKRPDEPGRFPQHVTLRIADGVPSLAREGLVKIIRAAIKAANVAATKAASAGASGRSGRVTRRRAGVAGFRIVEFNVLGNHLHLITEAENKAALARGIQGLKVRVARHLNSALRRSGDLFSERYHARYLKTPKEVRNALRYVLLNRKRHAAEQRFARQWVDPFSSAAWFDGWAQPIRADEPWKRSLLALDSPTAKATVWLLTDGWRKHGLLKFDERPGPEIERSRTSVRA